MGTDSKTGKDKPSRAVFIVGLLFALIGVGLSGELINVHRTVHSNSGAPVSCGFGEGMDCGAVAENQWGEVFGVPTAAWGLLFYAGFALLTILGITRKVFPKGPGGLIFWGTIPALLFGGFLIYIMIVEVQDLCIYCLGLDGVHLGLLAIGAIEVWRRGAITALKEDIAALWANKPSMIAIFGGPSLAAFMIWAAFHNANTSETGQTNTPPLVVPDAGVPDIALINDEHAPSQGPEDALIVIYEFSDYQCPHCRRAHEDVRAIIEEHPDQIRLYHFNNPLGMACNPQINRPFHPAACMAAAAAICAQNNDKFWELNDLLFEHGRELDERMTLTLATRVGLDREEMSRCMASERTEARILHDLEQSMVVPVRGTPTFVLNGRIIPGYIGPNFARLVDLLLENDGRWPENK